MTRVCPECKTQLKESDYYFCTSCGAELSTGVNSNVHSYAFKVTKFSTPGKKLNPRPLLLAFASVLLVVGVFILLRMGLNLLPKHTSSSSVQQPVETMQKATKNLISSSELSISEIKFGMPSLITYVPSDVDFYLEAGDFPKVYSAFIKDFAEKPFIDVLLPDVADQFIVSGREIDSKWQLALFLKITNQAHILEELDSMENSNWRVVLVKDVLVISNSDKFVEDIVSSSNGIIKNVSLNPKFVTAKAQLQGSGKVLFIDLNSKFDSAYNLLSYYKASSAIQTVFDDAKKQEYDKFVLTHE